MGASNNGCLNKAQMPRVACVLQGGFVVGGGILQVLAYLMFTPLEAFGCLLVLFAAAQVALEVRNRRLVSCDWDAIKHAAALGQED